MNKQEESLNIEILYDKEKTIKLLSEYISQIYKLENCPDCLYGISYKRNNGKSQEIFEFLANILLSFFKTQEKTYLDNSKYKILFDICASLITNEHINNSPKKEYGSISIIVNKNKIIELLKYMLEINYDPTNNVFIITADKYIFANPNITREKDIIIKYRQAIEKLCNNIIQGDFPASFFFCPHKEWFEELINDYQSNLKIICKKHNLCEYCAGQIKCELTRTQIPF